MLLNPPFTFLTLTGDSALTLTLKRGLVIIGVTLVCSVLGVAIVIVGHAVGGDKFTVIHNSNSFHF
jgi:hypothetical protein